MDSIALEYTLPEWSQNSAGFIHPDTPTQTALPALSHHPTGLPSPTENENFSFI